VPTTAVIYKYTVHEKKRSSMGSDKEHGIDTAIVFGVVRDLRILAKHNLSTSCDHSKFRDVDLDDSAFGEDTKLCIHRRLWVFLDA